MNITTDAFVENNLLLSYEVEPLEQVIDSLKVELKNRHIRRLQEGKCTIELGFVLSDILNNFERVSDHCSNIAVCLIQIKDSTMDTHGYLNEIKTIRQTRASPAITIASQASIHYRKAATKRPRRKYL